MFKVNNKDTGIFIVNFEHILQVINKDTGTFIVNF